MSEEFAGPDNKSETPSPGPRTGADDWLVWLQQIIALFVALGGLVSAEGRLAIADAKRLLIAMLALIPFALLTWLSLCVWLAWSVYAWSGSVGSALFAFFTLQAAVTWYLSAIIKTSRNSMSLPRTRQHLRELLEDIKRGSSGSGN